MVSLQKTWIKELVSSGLPLPCLYKCLEASIFWLSRLSIKEHKPIRFH